LEKLVIYVTNAIEDNVRISREIDTDSPACSRKVFLTCKNLNKSGVKVIVISLGRGRTKNKFSFYSSKITRRDNFIIIYAPFCHLPIISHLVSLFWPFLFFLTNKFRFNKYKTVFFFWNRTFAFVPILLISIFHSYKTILDLEDGDIFKQGKLLSRIKSYILIFIYDTICHGVVVTNTSLMNNTLIKSKFCFYGIQPFFDNSTCIKNTTHLDILFSGTIIKETGAEILYNAIKKIRNSGYEWSENLLIHVTGKGDSINLFYELQSKNKHPLVKVYGRLDDENYKKVLDSCNVGLALKLPEGPLASTTFPSKVLEYVNSNLLILTTDISDVKLLLKDEAIYTNGEEGNLISKLEYISKHKKNIFYKTEKAKYNLNSYCTGINEIEKLKTFIFTD
jgi:glycosyltransferase involved in cell wall biosynthesis